jgi:hypothetical protein
MGTEPITARIALNINESFTRWKYLRNFKIQDLVISPISLTAKVQSALLLGKLIALYTFHSTRLYGTCTYTQEILTTSEDT